MIAYFDTSAVVPILVGEAASEHARRLWTDATRVVSCLLLYAEASAALAAAHRQRRLDDRSLRAAFAGLEALFGELHPMHVDELLVRRAGTLSSRLGLRGYDSVHLAAAERLADEELLFVAGDRALCAAAREVGLRVGQL